MTWAAVAVGVVSAGTSIYSANRARKDNQAALASENQRIANLQDEINIGRENAAELREERDVPSELFGRMLRDFPGLLDSVLPQLTETAVGTTDQLASAGADQFTRIREQIQPGITQLQSDRLAQIQSLNPENLGQEEIAAITRQLSPLLPAGTLDPGTGAVSGATTSPVSLYRNLISSKFGERRGQFLDAAGQFSQENSNAAARQQVSAADFLDSNLNRAFSTSAGLAGADIEQQQGDIDAQEAFIRLAASGLASTFDPSANNAIIAEGTKNATDSLASAANALAAQN